MRVGTVVLSHVDKRWIKQRPQFVAEELNRAVASTVLVYAWAYRRGHLTDHSLSCRSVPVFMVPHSLRDRWAWLDGYLQALFGVILGLVFRPRVVWITSPRMALIGRVMAATSRAKVVYDLMDRMSEFANTVEKDAELEHYLLTNADLTVCSSETLLNDAKRAGRVGPTQLMRNALAKPDDWRNDLLTRNLESGQCVLGYAGTLSGWFDWECVTEVLNRNSAWILRVWGPSDEPIPNHPQVQVQGVAAHSALPGLLASCDVLVMPFKITRLIEAVDPVKAYEYIATGRPVVLPRYAETGRLSYFASLYEPGNPRSFEAAVNSSLTRDVDSRQLDQFCEENTWQARVAQVVEKGGVFPC